MDAPDHAPWASVSLTSSWSRFHRMTLLPVALVVRKAVTPGQEFALTLNPLPEQVTLDALRHVVGRTLADGTWLFGRQLLNSLRGLPGHHPARRLPGLHRRLRLLPLPLPRPPASG